MNRALAASLSLATLAVAHGAHAQTAQEPAAPIVVTGNESASPPPPAQPAAPPPPPTTPMAPVVVTPTQPTYAQQPPPGMPPFYVQRRVVPYRGGPVPPFARIETRPRTGMVIAGGVLFGALYLSDALVGLLYGSTGLIQDGGYLAIPVLGPVIWGAVEPGVSSSPFAMALLVVDSLAQAGGVVMFGVGMALRTQVLVFQPPAARGHSQTHWAVAPMAPGSSLGASIVGTF